MTLSLSPEVKANLEAIALNLGITWGERGNVSRMIEMIGAGDLTVSKRTNHKLKISESLVLVEKTLEAALETIKQSKQDI